MAGEYNASLMFHPAFEMEINERRDALSKAGDHKSASDLMLKSYAIGPALALFLNGAAKEHAEEYGKCPGGIDYALEAIGQFMAKNPTLAAQMIYNVSRPPEWAAQEDAA